MTNQGGEVRTGLGWAVRKAGVPLLMAVLSLAGCAHVPRHAVIAPAADGGRVAATLYLSEAGPDQADARFDWPRGTAQETRLTLQSTAPAPFAASLRCDGPVRLLEGAGAGTYLRPGATGRFTLPSKYDPAPRLALGAGVSACALTWGDNHLSLVAEDRADPAIAALDTATATCLRPDAAGLDPLARVFFADSALSETCARPASGWALYPDETEALRLRLEKLTGSPLSRAALDEANPMMPLDFSHAPRFDEIVVSYLHMRADITGYLMVRALAFHAARGTKVRILLSRGVMLGFDKRLFEQLASQYPNVQIQYFSWTPNRLMGPAGIAESLGRSHHIKLFAALSDRPGASFAIVGGRNLHDMFYFPNTRAEALPAFLRDDRDREGIRSPLDYFSGYEEFEIGTTDHGTVVALLSQFGKYWNRDFNRVAMAPATAGTRVSAAAPRDGVVRHILSLPWADGWAQEDLYVAAIDAARHEVLAISPFTYPTPAIEAALMRAKARGVKVRMVTRHLGDEPPAFFVNGLNSLFAIRHRNDFDIVTYTPEGRLLHTKLLVIDRRLSLVASTNLNRRSFVHDGENGLIILDKDLSQALAGVVETAFAGGQPMTDDSYLAIGRLIEAVPGLLDYF